MADFSMYGPLQNGARLWDQDQQSAQLHNIAIQEGQAKVAMDQMRVRAAQQQQAQQQLQQQRLNQILMRDANGSVMDIGSDMIKAGMIKEGSDLLDKTAQIEQRFASADKARADASLKQIDERRDMISTASSMLSKAHSQEDYQNVIRHVEQFYGQKLPDNIRNAEFTPELKSKLIDLATNAKQKHDLQIEQMKQQRWDADRASRDKLNAAREEETKARTKEIQIRTEREQKNGGLKPPTAITDNEFKASFSLLQQDFPDLTTDSPEGRNAAYYVAGRAKTLLQKNPGLDQGTALQQSLLQAKKDGIVNEKTITNQFMGFDVSSKKSFGFDSSKEKMSKSEETKSKSQPPAPPAAIDYLRAHPNLRADFKAKYGYLPDDEE